jgi:predicted O-methyltransferase YrrM
VLEIGVATGASIRTWLEYFPGARVVGLDADPNVLSDLDESLVRDPRLDLVMVDQARREDLGAMLGSYPGPYDLILDDGGHTMAQQQTSLAVLFPHVRPGGFYVIEDLHTSLLPCVETRDGAGNVRRYETGCDSATTTTLAFLRALRAGQVPVSDWMGVGEVRFVLESAARIEVCDVRGDGSSITSCIVRR